MDLQKKNRSIILQTLMKYSPISRIDLSRMTELNKATITAIIREFLELGIVKNVGSILASNGRKVAGISLCMEEVVTIVLRIKAHSFNICLCDINGGLEEIKEIKYENDVDIYAILRQLQQQIDNAIAYCEVKKKKILGISIATLGWLYHHDNKYYIKTDGVPVLGEVDFKEELSKSYPERELWIDHDANMSALAEWQFFCDTEARTPGSMLSIVGGIGFGGGIIIGGEVFSGHNGIAGEVGHMGINCLNVHKERFENGASYGGKFEDYASPLSLRRLVVENLYDYPDSKLTEESSLEEIYRAYEVEDRLAVWAVNRIARYLAYGLTGLIFILNPEVIVLGDEVIKSEMFSKQLHKYLKLFLPEELYENLDIRFSSYDKNGVLIGAGKAMIKHYFRTQKFMDFVLAQYRK